MKLRFPQPTITACLAADSADAGARTVDATFYTGAEVPRFSWDRGSHMLSFDMRPAAVDLSRLNSGAPVLDSHQDGSTQSVIGVVEQAQVQDGAGSARLRFAQNDPAADRVWNLVEQKVLRNVSMGVSILAMKETTKAEDKVKSFLATKWQPYELSIVPVGADGAAQIRMQQEQFQEIEVTMPETNTTTQNTDAAERLKIAKVCGLDANFSNAHADVSLDEFRRLAIDAQAAADAALPQMRTAHVGVTRDRKDGLVSHMAEAITCRFNGKAPSEGAREFSGASIVDMARELLTVNGQRMWSRSHAEIIRLALNGTSDFPALLTESGNRMLMAAYSAAQPAIKQAARRSTARDFRTKSLLRLGEAPALLEVNEHGEVTRGSRVESKESYRLRTYARIFGITRQALINDDLGAFADTAGAFGLAAATIEGSLLTDLLVSNPTMEDTVALFDAAHANVSTGGGSALGTTGLTAARLALRKTTGLDGSTILDIQPALLLVPAALETTAQQTLAAIFAAEVANANPFAGTLKLLVDPRLDAASTAAWYLLADPAGPFPVLEYSHLEGQEGLSVETRVGFDVEGVEIKARIDYGVGAVGFRGAVRSAGS